ncbi:MAG TPA: MlaD family protein [Phycisphaerae bacterium]|nr:MlaD family protein [Phycisphaerae bacterium]
MNDSRFGFKVGLFIFVGVALLALLILSFSSGVTLGRATYKLQVIMPNAAGLKPAADVLLSGVPIGKVIDMTLADDNQSVNITVSILKTRKIQKNAVFEIDSVGFLGDQYVKVTMPMENGLAQANGMQYYAPGDTVQGKRTPGLQEQIESVSGLLDQAKATLKDADEAITNVNHTVLSPETLGKVGLAVSNLQVISVTAVAMIEQAKGLLDTNVGPVNSAVSNFLALSASLTNTAAEFDQIIVTNRDDVRQMIANLKNTSDDFKKLAADLQAGKGVAGGLLKDEKMKAQMASLISNANTITAEFSTFGSNLNQNGIWGVLWKPRHTETNQPPVRAMRP